MSSAAARDRLLDWLGDVGPRWGIPDHACRVHGLLYLERRDQPPSEISNSTELAHSDVSIALAWLADHRLVEERSEGRWGTGSDPWDLVMRALEIRRQRELRPALEALRESRREAAEDAVLVGQIDKLLRLLEDISAIDAHATRLTPATLRRLIGVGGSAARLFDKVFRQAGEPGQ